MYESPRLLPSVCKARANRIEIRRHPGELLAETDDFNVMAIGKRFQKADALGVEDAFRKCLARHGVDARQDLSIRLVARRIELTQPLDPAGHRLIVGQVRRQFQSAGQFELFERLALLVGDAHAVRAVDGDQHMRRESPPASRSACSA